ncbi:hypothetical protein [Pseudoalteromonas piscicida]|uniref:hypothetical protein n=1 Tax=Pseudoalteromonas piscicida TaxID=43662 RepID=UPI0030A939D1
MEKFLIGIAGVFVGALLTVLRESFNEWRSKRNHARYLAVRVICLLERFISGCFEVVCDNGVEDQHGCLVISSKAPTIDFDGIDGKWQSLKFDLMYRILDLPNRLNYANEEVSIAAEYGDGAPEYRDAFRVRQYQYALLGIEASELVEILREKYSMPKKSYDTWNPLEKFLEKKAEIDAIDNK